MFIVPIIMLPFSRGFPEPRDQTQVSYIAGGFFTIWTTKEVKGSIRNINENWIIINKFQNRLAMATDGLRTCCP